MIFQADDRVQTALNNELDKEEEEEEERYIIFSTHSFSPHFFYSSLYASVLRGNENCFYYSDSDLEKESDSQCFGCHEMISKADLPSTLLCYVCNHDVHEVNI